MRGTRYHMNSMKYHAVRCIFEGMSYKEAAIAVWKLDPKDPEYESKLKKCYQKILLWKDEDEFDRCYKEMCKQEALPRYSRAMALFDKQMGNKNPWVAQGAARELANRYGPTIMGEEQNTVTVKVEGMPEMGTPDEE